MTASPSIATAQTPTRLSRLRTVLGALAGAAVLPMVVASCAAPTSADAGSFAVQLPTTSEVSAGSHVAPAPKVEVVAPEVTTRVRPSAPTQASVSIAKPSSGDRWRMVPMPKLPPYNNATIKNSSHSTRSINVCRDWGTSSCRHGSPTGVLKPGQSSKAKYGWRDTDGYAKGRGWVKQHGCFGCTVTIVAR